MSGSCPRCGEPLRLTTRPAAERRSGPITAMVAQRRVIDCVGGCAPSPGTRSQDDERGAVLQALREQLVVAGGDPRSARCGACATTLELPMRATTRSVTAEPAQGTPFTVTFSLPVVRCGECGQDNVPRALSDTLTSAALAACGLGPTPDHGSASPRGVRAWFARRRRPDAPGSHGRPSRP